MSQTLTLDEEYEAGTKQVIVTDNVVYDRTGVDGGLQNIVTLSEFYRKLTEI